MTMTPVSSSNIRSIGHDPATNTLTVEFNNGAQWNYAGVSAKDHEAFLNAESVGSHFHANIRNGGFKASKVEKDK